MNFPLFTTIPPTTDFRPVLENWEQSGFRVTSINNREEAAILRAAGVNVLEVAGADKRLKIAQIMHAIAETSEPFAGFINADCRFTVPINVGAITDKLKNSIVLAERIDVDETGTAVSVLSLGFDAMFFDTSPLKSISHDVEYKIGMPWWDYWFPFYFKYAGLTIKRFSCPVLLHDSHALNWNESAWLRGAHLLQQYFPDLPVFENSEPNPHICFSQLTRTESIDLQEISRDTARLFCSISTLVTQIHTLQRQVGTLQTKINEEKASTSDQILGLENEVMAANQQVISSRQELLALWKSHSYSIALPFKLLSSVIRASIDRMRGAT